MHIAMIAKPGHPDSGVGRYVVQLTKALEALGHQVTIVHPLVPIPNWLLKWIQKWIGWDLCEFFNTYPVWARYPPADIYHLSSQNLATLMTFRRPPGKTVVTVHDIIPLLTRDDDELHVYRSWIESFFDNLAINSLGRTERIITVSDFTREQVLDKLDLHVDFCTTVLEGVN